MHFYLENSLVFTTESYTTQNNRGELNSDQEEIRVTEEFNRKYGSSILDHG